MPDCVFCEIVKTGIAEGFQSHFVVVSFIPLNPVVEGHRLFVPTVHYRDASMGPVSAANAFEEACDWGYIQEEEFNIITSIGSAATQTVFHTHIHYVPRRPDDGLSLPWTGQKKLEGR